MTPVLRFAPSPTGRLHLGNARAALVNWLFARHHGGRLILRLDDTDAERSTEAFAALIEQDLAWLGIDWDQRHRQSERGAAYTAALARLQAKATSTRPTRRRTNWPKSGQRSGLGACRRSTTAPRWP
jgi:glutamyl-tRNA synthetase